MSLDLFDYPRKIVWISVTEGYTDQSTGEWVPESSIETEIQAHISDITLKERQYLDPGVVEKGVRKLACDSSVGVVVGDRVVITEKDSSKTTWVVTSKLSESNLLQKYANISRYTYLLSKK